MRFEPPIVSELWPPKWERKASHIKPFPKHHENLTLLWSIKSRISGIWMNRVIDVRIYIFWNLDTWAHSKIIKDCKDEEKTPFLLGKFHETIGGEGEGSPEWALPQNVMLLFWSAHLCFPHPPDWFFLLENQIWKSYQAAHSSNRWNCPFHLLSGCQIN